MEHPDKLTADQQLDILADKVIALIRKKAAEEKSHFAAFDIPETDHEGRMSLSVETRFSWLLTADVIRNGSRKKHSHYLCHGKKEEVLAYLAGPELKEKFLRSIRELSRHVDDED